MRYRSGRNYRPWGLGDGIVSKEISAEWPQIEKCREQKWEYSIETIRRGIVTSRNCDFAELCGTRVDEHVGQFERREGAVDGNDPRVNLVAVVVSPLMG